MNERYYTNDPTDKTYAIKEYGKDVFCIYYDGWYAKRETHKVQLYEWAKHLHGNAPSGTPYGWIKPSRGNKRIIITI